MMSKVKEQAKLMIGRMAEACLPGIASEIDANLNPTRAATLKRLIVFSRTRRAMADGDFDRLEATLSTFWQGKTGDQFHSRFIDERYGLFLDQHAYVVDELAQVVEQSEAQFSRLVEIGCGDGQVLNHFARELPQVSSCIGLDINAAAIERAQQSYCGDSHRMSFVHTDAIPWLAEHPEPGTIILTNGGVLEYFSPASVAQLFSNLAQSAPCAIVLIEPLAHDHDLATQNASSVFGREHSFSHNYPDLLRNSGYSIKTQKDFIHHPTRWFTTVAVKA